MIIAHTYCLSFLFGNKYCSPITALAPIKIINTDKTCNNKILLLNEAPKNQGIKLFAAKITLNTQMLLEKNKEYSSEDTTYQKELYNVT